jgi:hypothetical protein
MGIEAFFTIRMEIELRLQNFPVMRRYPGCVCWVIVRLFAPTQNKEIQNKEIQI